MRQVNLYIFGLLIFCTSLQAQVDTTSLSTENVSVYKSYEAVIAQAQQKDVDFEISTSSKRDLNYSYQLNNPKEIDFEEAKVVINPLKHKGDQEVINDTKDGQVYGSYGNLSTIKAGLGYKYYIEDWFETGVNLHHFSANGASENALNVRNLQGDYYINYFLNPKTKVGIQAFGSYQKRSLDETLQTELDNFSLPFRKLGGSVNASHINFEKTGIAFRTRLTYDKLERLESNRKIDQHHETMLDWSTNVLKAIAPKVNFEVDIQLNQFGINTDQNKITDWSFYPRIQVNDDNIQVNGGIDFIQGTDVNILFPIVSIHVPSVFKDINVTLETEGAFNRYNMHWISENNPFLQAPILNDSLAGYTRSYKLSLSRDFGWFTPNLSIAVNDYENDVHYIQNEAVENIYARFELAAYDRTELEINPSININRNNLGFETGLVYRRFFNTSEVVPFYRPEVSIYLNATQELIDNKLSLKQMIIYNGSQNALNERGLVNIINPYWDVALRLDYKVNSSWSVFAEGTNLINQDIEVYQNVQNYGRQFWGGLAFRF